MANNPLDYLIQNPDAQRYALLQDASYKGGGAVHMEEGGRPPLRSLDEEPTMDQIRFELSQMANQRAVPTVDPAEVANNARYIAERQTPVDLSAPLPDMSAQFGVNAKPASRAYTHYDVPRVSESGGIAPLPRTIYDDRMAELGKQLDQRIKPDWMSFADFAQSQVDRGRGGGHLFNALGKILTIPEHITGSSMGLDPMLGLIGKTGELHSIPKAGRYMASQAAPFALKVDDMVRELHASGAMPQPGLSIKDVTPKALAPANAQGFYSPTEAAALNLQRKSGSGQALLNDLLKGENVKSDEISGMGLDTFLKDKKNVTAAEVQDYIAQNKLGLGESVYGEPVNNSIEMAKRKEILDSYKPEIDQLRKELEIIPLWHGEDADRVPIINPQIKKIQNRLSDLLTERDWAADKAYTPPEFKDPKFKNYSLPGGENYREVVITTPPNNAYKVEPIEGTSRWKVVDEKGELYKSYYDEGDANRAAASYNRGAGEYKSSHWDEPNVLAHLRMSDRVTDGKKTLLVDEVQSDWHQAARDLRTAEVKRLVADGMSKDQAQKAVPKDFGYANPKERQKIVDKLAREEPLTADEEVARRRYLASKNVPDAPYKDDYYQLALRRAIKEAIDGGYDRIALPTGARVAERFSLVNHVDSIDYKLNENGKYRLGVTDKDGFGIDLPQKEYTKEELPSLLGKDVANQLINKEGQWGGGRYTLRGVDLKIGGDGMKKYYDEVYPGYLKNFGKKYGATVGKTSVEVPLKRFVERSADPAKDLTEPLHYMDITPAMRKEFGTGIHMKRGGQVRQPFTPPQYLNYNIDHMRHELMRQG